MNAKLRRKKTEPRRPGRPRADEANQRERLLDAAVVCFAGEGIAATSLRTIALKAGVTPALVHYYFGAKEQLVDAFIAERVTPVAAALRRLARSGPRAARAARGVRARHARRRRALPWWPALWVREVLNEKGARARLRADRPASRAADRRHARRRAEARPPPISIRGSRSSR
jgi:AcrR family transcriptional regulator